jgi:hypothetical protein
MVLLGVQDWLRPTLVDIEDEAVWVYRRDNHRGGGT